MRTISQIAFIALAFTAAAPALCINSADLPRTRTVKTSDLDLGSADGMRHLNRRIETAVGEVCSVGIETRTMPTPAEQACRHQARDGAAVQIAAILQSHLPIQVASR
jgi:UrcA family protein